MSSKSLDSSAPGWNDVGRWHIVVLAGDNTRVLGTYFTRAGACADVVEYGLTGAVVCPVEDVDTVFGETAA